MGGFSYTNGYGDHMNGNREREVDINEVMRYLKTFDNTSSFKVRYVC
jgi:hypothetical protein